jgi:hypothetical protein
MIKSGNNNSPGNPSNKKPEIAFGRRIKTNRGA